MSVLGESRERMGARVLLFSGTNPTKISLTVVVLLLVLPPPPTTTTALLWGEQPQDDSRRGLGQAGRGAACVGWPCHGVGQFQRGHVLGAVPIGLGESVRSI